MKKTLDILWKSIISDPSIHTYLNKERIKWSVIRMGGFYERFVGITKMSLKKSIVKLSLTNSQPQTVLSGVKAILNTRSLIHTDTGLKPRKVITQINFYGSKS